MPSGPISLYCTRQHLQPQTRTYLECKDERKNFLKSEMRNRIKIFIEVHYFFLKNFPRFLEFADLQRNTIKYFQSQTSMKS